MGSSLRVRPQGGYREFSYPEVMSSQIGKGWVDEDGVIWVPTITVYGGPTTWERIRDIVRTQIMSRLSAVNAFELLQTWAWAHGLGPDYLEFGPDSPQSQALAKSLVVNEAVDKYLYGNFKQKSRGDFVRRHAEHAAKTPTLVDDKVGSLDIIYIVESAPGELTVTGYNSMDMASLTKDVGRGLSEATEGNVQVFMNGIIPAYDRHSWIPTPGGRVMSKYVMKVKIF